MARRNRKFSRRQRAPGESFWLRPPVFTVDEVDSVNSVFSTIILTEADFAAKTAEKNQTMKGAPVLERLVVDLGYSQLVTEDYYDPAQFGQVTVIAEAMVWTQSDQFATLAQDSTSFDTVLENERILGYAVMEFVPQNLFVTSTRISQSMHHIFEPKVRVKLREKSLAVAIRVNVNQASVTIEANFPWCQPTMLVRLP